jgi:hypothetical protein
VHLEIPIQYGRPTTHLKAEAEEVDCRCFAVVVGYSVAILAKMVEGGFASSWLGLDFIVAGEEVLPSFVQDPDGEQY